MIPIVWSKSFTLVEKNPLLSTDACHLQAMYTYIFQIYSPVTLTSTVAFPILPPGSITVQVW